MPVALDTRLEELEAAYEHVAAEMALPATAADPARLRVLGKALRSSARSSGRTAS